ncbi:MAG: hypothetical protein KA371_13655 [Acidobacteria bacterium]|jgi:hypothetical protein|nr:hypothetical protein [Acidobacteriota bacterium]
MPIRDFALYALTTLAAGAAVSAAGNPPRPMASHAQAPGANAPGAPPVVTAPLDSLGATNNHRCVSC